MLDADAVPTTASSAVPSSATSSKVRVLLPRSWTGERSRTATYLHQRPGPSWRRITGTAVGWKVSGRSSPSNGSPAEGRRWPEGRLLLVARRGVSASAPSTSFPPSSIGSLSRGLKHGGATRAAIGTGAAAAGRELLLFFLGGSTEGTGGRSRPALHRSPHALQSSARSPALTVQPRRHGVSSPPQDAHAWLMVSSCARRRGF